MCWRLLARTRVVNEDLHRVGRKDEKTGSRPLRKFLSLTGRPVRYELAHAFPDIHLCADVRYRQVGNTGVAVRPKGNGVPVVNGCR